MIPRPSEKEPISKLGVDAVRLEEIQRLFDEMGLGSPEDRQRYVQFEGAPFVDNEERGEANEEQRFIRLTASGSEKDEGCDG